MMNNSISIKQKYNQREAEWYEAVREGRIDEADNLDAELETMLRSHPTLLSSLK
jgi:hypothetical protein